MRNLYSSQSQSSYTKLKRSISFFIITINQIPGFFAGIATQKDNIGQHFCIYRPNILNIKNNPKVEFEDRNRFSWIYLADGTKLRKTFFDNTKNEITDYSGSFIYTKKGNLARELDYITTADGRITNETGVLKYEYHLKDHLGNTRLAINEDANEVSNLFYYPFGVSYAPSNSNKDIRYKYNGKEHDNDNNLNWYHYGVRFYDPEIGRWWAMDPADEFNSPYIYVGNNPIVFIDPDGAQAANGSSYKPGTNEMLDIIVTPNKPNFLNYNIKDILQASKFNYENVSSNIKLALSSLGTLAAGTEYNFIYGDMWRSAKNGHWYNKNWGGNKATGGRNKVLKIGKILKYTGNALSLTEIGLNAVDMTTSLYNKNFDGAVWGVANIVVGYMGMAGGWPGLAAALSYNVVTSGGNYSKSSNANELVPSDKTAVKSNWRK